MTLDMEVTQPWKTGSRQRFGKGVSVGPQDLSGVDRNRNGDCAEVLEVPDMPRVGVRQE